MIYFVMRGLINENSFVWLGHFKVFNNFILKMTNIF
jgi:hypothetical protein